MSVNQRALAVAIPIYSLLVIATLIISFSVGHVKEPIYYWNGYRSISPSEYQPEAPPIKDEFSI